jgi:hypothetical protein
MSMIFSLRWTLGSWDMSIVRETLAVSSPSRLGSVGGVPGSGNISRIFALSGARSSWKWTRMGTGGDAKWLCGFGGHEHDLPPPLVNSCWKYARMRTGDDGKWFCGTVKSKHVAAEPVRRGRRVTIVRTEVTGKDGRLLVDMTTTHVPARWRRRPPSRAIP